MKIAFLTPSISRAAGGIFEIERSLALELNRIEGTTVSVFGLHDEHTEQDRLLWEDISIVVADSVGPATFGYSKGLRDAFMGNSADVCHLHALWTYPSILIRDWSQKTGKPYVTTINGMLEPWAIRNSRAKKMIARALYEGASLNAAACLQVNTPAEALSVRRYGLKNPVCIVPNGVDLPALDTPPLPDHPLVRLKAEGRNVLLYLGRIHPKKNIASVIDAFASLADEAHDWVLAIAGWDQGGHIEELRLRAAGVDPDRIIFLGAQFGADKATCFALADGFILASHSEGFPMAVLEAWASATPVLISEPCNIDAGFAAGAAIKIGLQSAEVAEGLREFFALTNAERSAMGSRGRALVERDYTWPTVAMQMRTVYKWMLGGGAAPACVIGSGD